MFLHLSVSHSVQMKDLCMMSLTASLPGPMFLLGRSLSSATAVCVVRPLIESEKQAVHILLESVPAALRH